jgi:ubiquinone/menaquinone biosynthesis C-methylase UbiE
MSFKKYLPAAYIAADVDQPYRDEAWAAERPGKVYYEVHLSTIEQYEMAAPLFEEFLGSGGMKVLESGCGTGRWMAYFEKLGNRAVGIDDSWSPLRVAHHHDPGMQLARANVLFTPFRDACFDAAFSSYVAEHFEEGPEALFREIHRVLKPGGLFFVVVPFNNTFRRLIVNPALRLLYLAFKARGNRLAFTEFRFTETEISGFLRRTNFEIVRVLPDDFVPPWSKGLFVDLCDVGCFFGYEPRPPYELSGWLDRAARAIRSFGVWHSCEGIFYVARARK